MFPFLYILQVWNQQKQIMIARAPDKVRIFTTNMPISSPNSMFDHLLESYHWDDSDKWYNIGFGEKITQIEPIEVHFMHLIWYSDSNYQEATYLTSSKNFSNSKYGTWENLENMRKIEKFQYMTMNQGSTRGLIKQKRHLLKNILSC